MNQEKYMFLCGFGAGLAAAMLFAPKSGSETRGYLKSASGRLVDQSKDWVGRGKDLGKDLIERGKHMVGQEQQPSQVELSNERYSYR